MSADLDDTIDDLIRDFVIAEQLEERCLRLLCALPGRQHAEYDDSSRATDQGPPRDRTARHSCSLRWIESDNESANRLVSRFRPLYLAPDYGANGRAAVIAGRRERARNARDRDTAPETAQCRPNPPPPRRPACGHS